MSQIKRNWLFFFILFLYSELGFTQQPNLDFITFSELEEITNNKSFSIVQDSIGFMWIATEDGLFKFDGQSVDSYLHDDKDPNSLLANKTDILFIDGKQNLWISTSAGLCRYNPEMDNFIPFVHEKNLRGSAGLYINVIAEDKTGQLYIANENVIYKYDAGKDLFLKVTELGKGRINALVFDDKNNIWIGATQNGGLYYFEQNENILNTYFNNPKSSQSISNNEIRDIKLIDKKLWIATYGAGVDVYDTQQKTFKHYISPNYYENYSLCIFTDKKKNIWICTLGSLKLFDPSSDNFFNYYYDANNPKSLHKNLWRFYEDRQGNYWTLHSLGGICYVNANNKFKHFTSQPANFWHTSENNVTSIANDKDKNLWIGNYYNGVDVFKWKENKTERYVHQDNDKQSLGNGTIFDIFRDSRQQMWVCSNMGGLQRFNPATKKFDTYINNPNDSNSIATNDVRSIAEDSKGNIWVIVHGKGVDRFDPETKIFHHYNTKNSLLSNDYAFQVLVDSNDNLWVGSAYGLNVLKRGASKFKTYLSVPKDSTTINGNEIHSIHQDRKHAIWISTSEGLNRYNPESDNFTRFTPTAKNKHIVSIVSDRKNNIWSSSKTGISKLDPATGQFVYFDQSNGLLSKEYYPNSSFIDDNNEIYFGGINGIDIFNPDSLLNAFKQPVLVFTDFKLFNVSVSASKDSAIIQKHISHASKIDLEYKQNTISIFYQGIDLTNPDKLSYAYKLEGFDNDWIYVDGKQEANYTNLNAKKYTFRVKAKYEYGDWSKNEISIDIIVHPAWYNTKLFQILVVIIMLITPFAFVRWRTNRLKMQKEILEAIIIKRTSEIQNKNKLLNELNSTKVKLFSIISHDLRSPFNSILGFQEHLIDEYPNLTDAERIDMLNKAHSASQQVYTLVENLLSWSLLQTNAIQYQPEKLNLYATVHEKINLYQTHAESKGITIKENIAEDLYAYADINLLQATLRNLITNAIKFTSKDGFILVEAVKTDDWLNISVTDSGKGMTSAEIKALFKLENLNSQKGTNGEKGTGLGLLLCKDFIEKNKGRLTIESVPEKGSKFSFTIPASDQS